KERARRSGGAQPHPAARARNRALPPEGDIRGMGHRDSPEECGGPSAVCGAYGGFAAAARERRAGEEVSEQKMAKLQREEDRLNSVPLSLPVHISLLALRFYKTYLSILFAGNCRFHPTCSQYAYEAIERFGVGKIVWAEAAGAPPAPEPADFNRSRHFRSLHSCSLRGKRLRERTGTSRSCRDACERSANQ